MKAKDYIIIGGAVALFLLWQKNKTKKASSSTTTGGATGGANAGTTTGSGNATAGTSQVTSFPTPTSTEPEQVFGLGLPTGMDLPVLTSGTGIPTEVAVQEGGVATTPTPAIVHSPVLTIEESLESGGIRPINKPKIGLASAPTFEVTESSPIVVVSRPNPTMELAEI